MPSKPAQSPCLIDTSISLDIRLNMRSSGARLGRPPYWYGRTLISSMTGGTARTPTDLDTLTVGAASVKVAPPLPPFAAGRDRMGGGGGTCRPAPPVPPGRAICMHRAEPSRAEPADGSEGGALHGHRSDSGQRSAVSGQAQDATIYGAGLAAEPASTD